MNAHHSSAMFDKNNVLVVEATVREFQWANPHVWIQIIIKDEANNEEEWSIEGIGINTCLFYTSPSPRDRTTSRMPSSA